MLPCSEALAPLSGLGKLSDSTDSQCQAPYLILICTSNYIVEEMKTQIKWPLYITDRTSSKTKCCALPSRSVNRAHNLNSSWRMPFRESSVEEAQVEVGNQGAPLYFLTGENAYRRRTLEWQVLWFCPSHCPMDVFLKWSVAEIQWRRRMCLTRLPSLDTHVLPFRGTDCISFSFS